MAVYTVSDAMLNEEDGFFDQNGVAQSFFFFRHFDVVSDAFLDAVGVGPIARKEKDLSTYIATADVTIQKPITRHDPLRFEFSVNRIGGKSFGYRSSMFHSDTGELHAIYDAVSVTMDMNGTPTPVSLPDSTRQALAAYEGGEQ